jgi:hypothetical protein
VRHWLPKLDWTATLGDLFWHPIAMVQFPYTECHIAGALIALPFLFAGEESLWRRVDNKQSNSEQFFSSMVIGVNTLDKKFKTMCAEAGVPGYFTNHSMKAEQICSIIDKTGSDQLVSMASTNSIESLKPYHSKSHKSCLQISNALRSNDATGGLHACHISSW